MCKYCNNTETEIAKYTNVGDKNLRTVGNIISDIFLTSTLSLIHTKEVAYLKLDANAHHSHLKEELVFPTIKNKNNPEGIYWDRVRIKATRIKPIKVKIKYCPFCGKKL